MWQGKQLEKIHRQVAKAAKEIEVSQSANPPWRTLMATWR
jgi:hypothetical protein